MTVSRTVKTNAGINIRTIFFFNFILIEASFAIKMSLRIIVFIIFQTKSIIMLILSTLTADLQLLINSRFHIFKNISMVLMAKHLTSRTNSNIFLIFKTSFALILDLKKFFISKNIKSTRKLLSIK